MVLLVFSVLIGSQISDGIKASFNAFAIIGAVAVAFGMLLMGKRSWLLLYYLPPALVCVPIYRAEMPIGYSLSLVVFVCGILMASLRIISLKWRSHVVCDSLIVCMLVVCVWNYIQHPVSLQALDPDAEYVGGKEFFWGILAMVYYIALSSMSGSPEEILTTVRRSFYALCIGQSVEYLYAFKNIGFNFGTRYEILSFLACPLLYFVYCSASTWKILRTPKLLFLGLLALFFILINGRREVFGYAGEAIGFAALLKRELFGLAFCGGLVYALLFGLGAIGAWNDAPYSVQRVLTILPGVQVGAGAQTETAGSSKTRKMAWAYAFDTRYGRIGDYVWGDGFQTSTKELQRSSVAAMRGHEVSAQDFALTLASGTNLWHNGWLNTLKTLGAVGLTVVNLIFICGMVMLAQVSAAYKGSRFYPYIMAQGLVFVQFALSYMWGTQTLVTFFQTFQQLAMIKLVYCAAREQGLMIPLIHRRRYVPLMIRETQQSGTAAA
ncbi:MAG: hypothetical protein MJ051_00910 [Akkermansia sp.]|nr:hypothetical protein [Akkermansia sp.]